MATDQQALLLQVSADISRLEKQFAKAQGVVDKGSRAMERRAQDASTNLERFFGKTDPAKALDKVFDATRFKVLDSGVARVGIFGSALETLGPAGLAAAAGIGALTAAFAGAREAAKFADDINDTANRLHVTTDALQEYRYAIRAAGGEEKGADEALENFSVTLGKAQQGLAKSQRAFLALGFTKEQIAGFKDADEALQAVVGRIAGLSNVQKDAVIQQLGLDGIKPLIEGGVDAMQNLREEAHRVGIVMDADLIKRGGELNDQFETVSKVIDLQLKSALVDLGPILIGLLHLVADLAKAAASVADAFRSVQNKTDAGLQAQAETLTKEIVILKRSQQSGAGVSQKVIDAKVAQLASINDLQAQRKVSSAASPITPSRTLIDTSGSRGGGRRGASAPRDTTVQRTESVNGAIASAERDILQALLGLTRDVQARAVIQKQIIDAETEQAKARNAKQIADIEADKGLSAAKKAELVKQLEVVDAKTDEAARLKKQQIDAETADALSRQILTQRQTERDGEEELLRIKQGLSRSASEQQDIALRLVDLAYQREKAELESIIAAKGVSEADREIARTKLASLNAAQPGRVEDARRSGSDPAREANSIISDVSKKSNLAEDTAAMYAEVERQRQADIISEEQAAQAKAEINARYHEQRLSNAQSFFSDLATLSSSGNKTLAAIGKAAAIAQATIDGILAVQKALASAPPPLNFALAAAAGVAAAVNVAKIAGLAEGGEVVGPGGPRDDKVLTRLSNGEFVVNARDASRNRELLHQINSGRVPAFADGGQVGRSSLPPLRALNNAPRPVPRPRPPNEVTLLVHVNANGAIPREEIESMVRSGSNQAVAQARALSFEDAQKQRYSEDLNS